MGKRQFIGDMDINEIYSKTVHMLRNKYYNLYRANIKWKGDDMDYRKENYIARHLYNEGTIAAFNIPVADELGFAPWCRSSWDMYGEPVQCTLLNEFGSPFVPPTLQTVDEDVVIGYIQSNRKPIKMMVEWYIDRIAQVEMCLNTNLQLCKIPFLIPVEDEKEMAKVNDVVKRILNNEVVIGIEGVSPSVFQAIQTGAPYIIDKLSNYKKDLENDLLTYLGYNNSNTNKVEQLQNAEVNANNSVIGASDSDLKECLNKFCERIKDVLGKSIEVEIVQEQPDVMGQPHDMMMNPGPNGGGDNED